MQCNTIIIWKSSEQYQLTLLHKHYKLDTHKPPTFQDTEHYPYFITVECLLRVPVQPMLHCNQCPGDFPKVKISPPFIQFN